MSKRLECTLMFKSTIIAHEIGGCSGKPVEAKGKEW